MTHGGPRRGAGRKPSPDPTANRTERVEVRMTEAERAEIEAGAERLGVGVSDVLRDGGLRLVRARGVK